MPESYQSWADRMILEEHENYPERFTKYPPIETKPHDKRKRAFVPAASPSDGGGEDDSTQQQRIN